jgi:hypothetical protein
LTIRSPRYPLSELTKLDTTRLPVVAWQIVDVTASTENNSQSQTALGPQLEDPPRVATTKATLVVAAAPPVVAMVAAVAAVAEANHMALAEELVAAPIAEAEATRIAMSPATRVAAMTLATRSRRSIVKRLSKLETARTSSPMLVFVKPT